MFTLPEHQISHLAFLSVIFGLLLTLPLNLCFSSMDFVYWLLFCSIVGIFPCYFEPAMVDHASFTPFNNSQSRQWDIITTGALWFPIELYGGSSTWTQEGLHRAIVLSEKSIISETLSKLSCIDVTRCSCNITESYCFIKQCISWNNSGRCSGHIWTDIWYVIHVAMTFHVAHMVMCRAYTI